MTNYAIAYTSLAGTGFSPFEPLVEDGLDSLTTALEEAEHLRERFAVKAVPFCYDDEVEAPESITWSFVNGHIIDEKNIGGM